MKNIIKSSARAKKIKKLIQEHLLKKRRLSLNKHLRGKTSNYFDSNIYSINYDNGANENSKNSKKEEKEENENLDLSIYIDSQEPKNLMSSSKNQNQL